MIFSAASEATHRISNIRPVLTRYRVAISLAAVVAATLVLGIWGGTPFLHPDDIQRNGIRAFANSGNPEHFSYPGGWLNYLHGFLFVLVHEPLWFIRQSDLSTITTNPSPFLGSVVTSIFAAAGVISTYFFTYRLVRSVAVAFCGALFLGTSLLWVQDSHFSTVDVPFAAMAIVTIWFVVIVASKSGFESTKNWVILGLLIGLTASIRYQGIVLIFPVILASLAQFRNLRPHMVKIALMGAITLAVFLATNPYIILDFNGFWTDYTSQVVQAKNGGLGAYTGNGFWSHLNGSLLYGYGVIPLVLALIGAAWYLFSDRHPRPVKLSLLAFPGLTFLLIGMSSLYFDRYALPLIPFLAAFSAIGVFAIYRALYLSGPWRIYRLGVPVGVALILATAVLAGNTLKAVSADYVLSQRDTRQDLNRLIPVLESTERSVVGSGSSHTPFQTIQPENPSSLERALRSRILILDSFTHDPYLYDFHEPFRNASFTQLITSLVGASVFQISPYNIDKKDVPFAPKSEYSPALPDLAFRDHPGPFIEIYIKDSTAANTFNLACQRLLNCMKVSVGYYASPKQQSKLGLARLKYSLGFPW